MPAQLTFAPSPVAFGSQRINSTSVGIIATISNTGDVDLDIITATVTAPFVIDGLAIPKKLGPGASFPITIYYAPTQLGASAGTLTLTSDDPASPTTINLTGTGVSNATLEQERVVEFVSGAVEKFTLTNSLSNKGPLPHANIFVHRIVNTLDPKTDKFARIGRLSDITTLPSGRPAAVAAGKVEYLVSNATLSYADLKTAREAQKAIQDRVSVIVQDWLDYEALFVASPVAETINVPLDNVVSPEAKQSLIDAYKVAKKDRGVKTVAAVNALTEEDAAFAILAELKLVVAQMQTFYDSPQLSNDAVARTLEMTTAMNALGALINAAQTSVTIPAHSPAGADVNLQSAVDNATQVQLALANAVANHTTFETDLKAYLDDRVEAQAAAQVTYDTAVSNRIAADIALSSAAATEESARVALLAVCPDFDTDAVCAS